MIKSLAVTYLDTDTSKFKGTEELALNLQLGKFSNGRRFSFMNVVRYIREYTR